jgi:hypothetical protein
VFVILKYEFFIRQKYLNEKITLLNLVKLKLLLPISSNFIQSYSYTMERKSFSLIFKFATTTTSTTTSTTTTETTSTITTTAKAKETEGDIFV